MMSEIEATRMETRMLMNRFIYKTGSSSRSNDLTLDWIGLDWRCLGDDC